MNRKVTRNARLTDAKDDFVDVHRGEVEEEEGEVYNEEREAQNHTDPLLQPLSYRDNKQKYMFFLEVLKRNTIIRNKRKRKNLCDMDKSSLIIFQQHRQDN